MQDGEHHKLVLIKQSGAAVQTWKTMHFFKIVDLAPTPEDCRSVVIRTQAA
jgi:hypothetical protein